MHRRNLLKAAASLPLLSLQHSVSADSLAGHTIVVFGAGSFGSWTALKLVEQGADVTIVDPWGPGNSRSSSGGETRVIRSLYGTDRIYTEWVKRSFQLWKQLETDSHLQVYFPTGLIWMCSESDDYVRSSIPIAKEFDFQVDELTLTQGKQRFDQINFDGIKTLYYEHSAGYLMARQACRVVTDLAKSLGAKFVSGSAQTPTLFEESTNRVELLDGSSVSADHFVFACGPWLPKLFPNLIGGGLQPTRQEIHYFGDPQNSMSRIRSQLPIWVDFGSKLFYGIPGSNGRGFKVADDTRGPLIDPTSMDRVPSKESIEEAREFIAMRFPGMAGAPLLESRVCQYENSPDGHFIIDQHPDAKNVWIVGGGSGHGFKLSPAIGEFVANRIAGKVEHESIFSVSRLEKISSDKKTQFDQDKK